MKTRIACKEGKDTEVGREKETSRDLGMKTVKKLKRLMNMEEKANEKEKS